MANKYESGSGHGKTQCRGTNVQRRAILFIRNLSFRFSASRCLGFSYAISVPYELVIANDLRAGRFPR